MYDVFFLSFDETNADDHWAILSDAIPYARRVSGVVGIQNAHARCAAKASTSHFFVVDADSEIVDFSPFQCHLDLWDQGYVHLWFARNALNDLEYGWGGLKLFPKAMFANLGDMRLDMTTSFPLKIIPEVVSISHFNVSPFETWRAAFREAVKLSLTQTEEAQAWLETWCETANGPYAEECLRGAREGRDYAVSRREYPEELLRINDYVWLKTRFIA